MKVNKFFTYETWRDNYVYIFIWVKIKVILQQTIQIWRHHSIHSLNETDKHVFIYLYHRAGPACPIPASLCSPLNALPSWRMSQWTLFSRPAGWTRTACMAFSLCCILGIRITSNVCVQENNSGPNTLLIRIDLWLHGMYDVWSAGEQYCLGEK